MLQNMSSIANVEMSTLPRKRVVSILLYGKEDLSKEKNLSILREVTNFITLSKRLDTT